MVENMSMLRLHVHRLIAYLELVNMETMEIAELMNIRHTLTEDMRHEKGTKTK